MSSQTTVYLNSGQVRARYGGRSDMGLWRWLHNDELGFPQPLRINGRRFWREADLDAWERSRAPAGVAAELEPQPVMKSAREKARAEALASAIEQDEAQRRAKPAAQRVRA